jgi:hypothetical protein
VSKFDPLYNNILSKCKKGDTVAQLLDLATKELQNAPGQKHTNAAHNQSHQAKHQTAHK